MNLGNVEKPLRGKWYNATSIGMPKCDGAGQRNVLCSSGIKLLGLEILTAKNKMDQNNLMT